MTPNSAPHRSYPTATDEYNATIARAITKAVAAGIYPTYLDAAQALNRKPEYVSVWLNLPPITTR